MKKTVKASITSSRRLPTYAFGYEFNNIPEHVREDVSSLEREGVIYSDQWVNELDDFRHVRITFTSEEAKEFARRTWAYELFIKAGSPEWARDVPDIDDDVAKYADEYSITLKNGLTIPPPWHSFTAFLGNHLERILIGGAPERRTVIELQGKESVLFTLERAIQALTPVIRSFRDREKGLAPWPVEREDDVRDLLYAMLRPTLADIVKEEPTPMSARTYKFVDLCSAASRILIELKWIRKKGHWKTILDEIRVDIQSYPSHPACETLIFVIVDAHRDIPDPRLIEAELSGIQEIRERRVDIRTFVVEP